MAEEAPVHDNSVLLDRSEEMATITLGHMLDVALGSSKAGTIDFEQLFSLLNGMLLHLGLRDLAVQENGEPLEGSERSPFSAAFLEELKRKVEANENEIAEVRALCRELHEEVIEMKVEHSRMVEDMQRMQEDFGMNMEELRNQLLAAMTDMMTQGKKGSRDLDALSSQSRPYDDQDLIVIGNEITLLERPVSRAPGDIRPISPLPPKAKAQGRGKGLLEVNESGHLVSEANDMGQNMGQNDVRWNAGQSDMGRKGTGWNVGQNDTGQNDMGWNAGQKGMRRSVQLSNTGQNDMGQNDMGQIKDEEMKIRISKVEALPSPLDGPPEMDSMGEIKDEEMKMRISKAPPDIQKKSLDGGFTASGMHPGAPGTHVPVQQVQPMRGHPGSQNVWIPDKSVPGTSRELPATGYSRRSPLYCGGKHTTTYPVQPMEPLLPDPNKPGVCDLMGKDGLLYRGRTP
ncbi:hypothetical protein Nmel_016204 [Mimus melanotis]